MASMLWKSWKLSRWTLNTVQLSSKGSKTLRSMPTPWLLNMYRFSSSIPSQYSSVSEKIKTMQKYFEQYAEDYVEETESVALPVLDKIKEEHIIRFETLDDVVSLLNEERAKDIVVLSNLSSHISSMVICSPFNNRHGSAIAEALRRATKNYDDQVRRIGLQKSSGWYIVNIGTIQVNVMSDDARNRYDIEGLWGIGDEEPEPEIPLIPPSRQ